MSSRRPLCSPCPEHSLALENASTFCECQDSYARSPTDPPWASCTREFPSRPHHGGWMGGWWSIKGGLSVGEGRGLRTGEEESGSVTRGGGRRTWGGNGGRGLGSEEPGKQGGLGQRGEAALLDTSPNGPTPPHLILLSSTSHSVLGPNSPIPLIGPAARPAPRLAPTLRVASPRCPAQQFPAAPPAR